VERRDPLFLFCKMIFSVFVFMAVLSVVFFLVGYIIDLPLLTIVGSIIFFGLGLLVVAGDVQVLSGESVSNVLDVNGSVISSSSSLVYSDYDFGGIGSTSFGVILLLLGAFLFVIALTTVGD
jgi:hypothetical protein